MKLSILINRVNDSEYKLLQGIQSELKEANTIIIFKAIRKLLKGGERGILWNERQRKEDDRAGTK